MNIQIGGKRHRCFNITAFLLVLNDFIDVLCISLIKTSSTIFMEEFHGVYILTCPLKLDVYAFDPTALHDIQIFFSTSTFGLWCRGISLKDKVLVTGRQKKRCLIYGGTIHRTIREVFNKCRSLLRK